MFVGKEILDQEGLWPYPAGFFLGLELENVDIGAAGPFHTLHSKSTWLATKGVFRRAIQPILAL